MIDNPPYFTGLGVEDCPNAIGADLAGVPSGEHSLVASGINWNGHILPVSEILNPPTLSRNSGGWSNYAIGL
jgi:hypothetical protein